MNTKARLLFATAAAVLLLGGMQMLSATPSITLFSSTPIAPSSIPVPKAGDPNLIVGMHKVEVQTDFGGSQPASIDQVVVQLISSGGFDPNDIASIFVWWEPPNKNGLFDNGTPIDDVDVLVGSYTFSTNPVTITLDRTKTEIGSSTRANLYVGVALKPMAVTAGKTIGVQMLSFRQYNKDPVPVPPHGQQKPLDLYQVNLAAENIAPASQDAGESAPVLKLTFTPADPDATTAIRLESIRLHGIGLHRRDSDINPGGVVLYEDTNGSTSYEEGADSQIASATMGMGGADPGYATITPGTPLNIPPTGRIFFTVVNIALSADYATPNVVGLEIEDLATDVTFRDAYEDDNTGSSDYAYVPSGYPYLQEGYLLAGGPVPLPNTPLITITEQLLKLPPVVTSIVPGMNASNVSRSTTVVAIFSKPMKASTINTTNFRLFAGSTEVPSTVVATDDFTATLTPVDDLDWGTTFTAIVYGNGSSGVQDNVLGEELYMEANKVWSFSTPPAIHPIVVSRNPAHGALEVDPSTDILAAFNKSMDGSTFDTTTCLLFEDTNDNYYYDAGTDILIPRTVSLTSPQVVTINPDAALDWNKLYTVNVTTDVASLDGLHMQDVSYWFFTTRVLRNPAVLGYSPGKDATGVTRSASITVAFSKDLDDSTVNSSTFLVQDSGGTPVVGDISFDHDTYTATFDPISDMAYGTYTVTIKGGPAGVKDTTSPTPQELLADVTWNFSTVPSLTEPVAANNRIQPGVNDHTMIFIPQPPAEVGGASARVTVQVFTPTGKRVATLLNNQTWSSFETSLPLAWYGKNGRNEDLGPGLYFIRISAGKWVRALKVMIVR
jgi:hypothetical protein